MPRQLSIIENQIVAHCQEENPAHLATLLDKRDEQLLSTAAQHASVTAIQVLLARLSLAVPEAEKIVLENSAVAGNVEVFRYMLHRHPSPHLTETLRSYAVTGGVAIWGALLEFNPECINWPIGEKGDALGLAVERRNADLVRFLLAHTVNLEKSNVMGVPVLTYAKSSGRNSRTYSRGPVSPDIIDLLEEYRAKMKRNVD